MGQIQRARLKCPKCGKTFLKRSWNQRFCSKRCCDKSRSYGTPGKGRVSEHTKKISYDTAHELVRGCRISVAMSCLRLSHHSDLEIQRWEKEL